MDLCTLGRKDLEERVNNGESLRFAQPGATSEETRIRYIGELISKCEESLGLETRCNDTELLSKALIRVKKAQLHVYLCTEKCQPTQ